jgi:PleD family two-component response regulator
MLERLKLIAFDLGPDSLATLREAFPDWEIEAVSGATRDSLERDWNPTPASLLVVAADEAAEMLGLCRGLRSQVGRAHTPLLVLLSATQGDLAGAALEAGAHSCLVLPVHAQDLAGVVARAQRSNSPGRHTLNLDRAQREDPWRDAGGEA